MPLPGYQNHRQTGSKMTIGTQFLSPGLRAGELTPVWIPDLTHEAMRDLIRARAAAKRDSRVARQRILSMLLRTDKHYAGKLWTEKHRTWLANQSFSQPSQQIAFQHYC